MLFTTPCALHFFSLVPFIVNIIHNRNIRRQIHVNNNNLLNVVESCRTLNGIWLEFLTLVLHYLKLKRNQRVRLAKPHTLIALLVGYR